MKIHIIENSNAKKIEGLDFNIKFQLHSNCDVCENLSEEECISFGKEISNNKIMTIKWNVLCNILTEEWADKSGCGVILYHTKSYEEAKYLNEKHHLGFKYNITQWGDSSYILTKWYGDLNLNI